MNYTPEQEAIRDLVHAGQKSLVVQAGPGCGKTYTSVMTMANSGYGYKLALAYNKSIADELRTKAPPGVTVQTTHSAGYQMLKSKFRSKLNTASPWSKSSKYYKIVQTVLPNKFSSEFGAVANLLSSTMDSRGYGASHEPGLGSDPDDWLDPCGDLVMTTDERHAIAMRMPDIMRRALDETEEITFPEMLILPLRYDLEPQFPQTKIWGDEIQDWAWTQHALASRLGGPNTLYYGFGDKFQSIYAFRGADINAVDNFRDAYNAQEMPLTVSFRCPLSVIELARRRNPALSAPPGTPDGIVGHINRLTPDDCDDYTMVLCRMNAPLFSFGLKFLAKGRPVRVSSNMPAMLKKIIRSLKTDDKSIFAKRLETWYLEQLDYAEDNPHLRGGTEDRYNALISILNASDSVDDMITNIDRLTRGATGPLLSTVHKAKGLEAPKVILLASGRLIAPGEEPTTARPYTQEEIEQEWNVWFVAVTRAMDSLYFA